MKTEFAHLATAASLVVLAACSSTAPNANLDAATTTYNQASNDPAVVKDAPLELQQSRDALTRAQDLWRNGADRADVDHYAYLAMRRAELAQETAKLKGGQAQLANADTMRAQALLSARTEEANQARQQAAEAKNEAAQAQSEAARLQQQLTALKSDQASTVLTVGSGVLFDVNKATLKPGAYDVVRQIATYLKQHPDRAVTVEGFTDSTGSADYNLSLSQLRAEAMRDALVHEGIASNRIVARGMGESDPVASNDTEAGRQLNRRVQIAISGSNMQAGSGSSTSPGAPSD